VAERQRRTGSNLMFAQITQKRHKGYGWTATAFKAGPSADTVLTVQFGRVQAQKTQAQISAFTWTLPARALQMDPADLKPASLDTRNGMGSNGRISMKLSDPGVYGRFPNQTGCSGSISVRVGSVSGRFRLHARDLYFKRLELNRAKIVMYRERDFRCDQSGEPPPPECVPYLQFDALDEEAAVAVGAFKSVQGRVDQIVSVARKSGDADAVHTISVTIAAPESFEASEDLTTAAIDGDAAGPWLSGDLNYVAPPATEAVDESCGPYQSSSGIATGDFTAHFDSIGPVTPASTGMAATLRREN
jgi:hypothetical protein